MIHSAITFQVYW